MPPMLLDEISENHDDYITRHTTWYTNRIQQKSNDVPETLADIRPEAVSVSCPRAERIATNASNRNRLSIPEGTNVDGDIREKLLPGGSYAVMRAELTEPAEFEAAWNALVDWVEKGDYELDWSRPSYEVYINNPEDHSEKHHILDLCLSVAPK